MNKEMLEKVKAGKGFIAALDQSGGSTPKALKLYGIDESEYSGESEMYDLIHKMRSRLIKSPAFTSDRIVGAILFEMTMERDIDGIASAEYLWSKKKIPTFLKVDNGLAAEANDVQLMKPIPELASRISAAVKHGVFGTKMRSVINLANPAGIEAIVAQQFEIGKQIIAGGLMPIIEPEVNINSAQPGLFFADNTGGSGKLFKVGPCAVGGVAPNSGATGNPGQLGNTLGELWLDTTSSPLSPGPKLKVWDGTQWINCMPYTFASALVSDTEPALASFPDGTMWWNSDNGLMYVLYNDGITRQWVQTSSNTVS